MKVLKPPCVLVVDDDRNIRELCAVVLRDDDGYRVQTAVNGQDALDQLGCAPDLILLDLGMPLMDGREFVAQLRRVPKYESTPVLVMTAALGIGPVQGTQGTIQKPFENEALLGRIAGLLAPTA
ncbi:MAG: response regulator [Chloroflexota bacterium]|nr:response regulator [Chloroflexota bacterium]